MKELIKVKIFDNHKIPKKYRKGYEFYKILETKPSCEGDNWKSKNTYFKILALKIGTTFATYPDGSFNYYEYKYNKGENPFFDVLKNLCAVQICEGGKFISALKATDNTVKG